MQKACRTKPLKIKNAYTALFKFYYCQYGRYEVHRFVIVDTYVQYLFPGTHNVTLQVHCMNTQLKKYAAAYVLIPKPGWHSKYRASMLDCNYSVNIPDSSSFSNLFKL